jgi:hypothetical protein
MVLSVQVSTASRTLCHYIIIFFAFLKTLDLINDKSDKSIFLDRTSFVLEPMENNFLLLSIPNVIHDQRMKTRFTSVPFLIAEPISINVCSPKN